MLTREANQRLTQVGPGTPMGALMRRYWHPIATLPELTAESVLAVTVLGENLALYRTERGELGLVAQRCPHRGASLAYGIPEQDGLRCAYHGWKFDAAGTCLEQPAEPSDSSFKDRVRIPAYVAQEMGGLIWAYLGPTPAPLLPRYDLFVRDDLDREIGITRLPCNWLQIMENSLDPVHLEYLHSVYMNYVLKRQGKPPASKTKHHARIAFDIFEYGIIKRRLWEGDPEDTDEWQVGHPILFPNILSVGEGSGAQFQIRTPMDDTHTYHVWYRTKRRADGAPRQKPASIPVLDYAYKHEDGRLVVDTVSGQDMMVWVTQGPISDRTTERLGTTDKGVILYRGLLEEQMQKVERGEDPMAVVRDPARNEPMIEIGRERNPFQVSAAGPDLFALRRELAATTKVSSP
jgi:5,5'-dehydrodivanillate O-demethylase oxygenase subunit